MTTPDTHPIFRLTDEAFQKLTEISKSDPEVFYQPDSDLADLLRQHGVAQYAEPTGLHSQIPINLSDKNGIRDHQGFELYDSIPGLTALHLADHKMLAWLSCFPLRAYGLTRWNRPGKDPSNYARQHYLAQNPRYMASASVAGRPLWMAEIAHRAVQNTDAFTAQDAFEHFLNQTDAYGYCIYHEVLRVPQVLSEYLASIMLDEPTLTTEGARRLAQDLNRAASARLIDYLSPHEVTELIATSRRAMNHDPALMHLPQIL